MSSLRAPSSRHRQERRWRYRAETTCRRQVTITARARRIVMVSKPRTAQRQHNAGLTTILTPNKTDRNIEGREAWPGSRYSWRLETAPRCATERDANSRLYTTDNKAAAPPHSWRRRPASGSRAGHLRAVGLSTMGGTKHCPEYAQVTAAARLNTRYRRVIHRIGSGVLNRIPRATLKNTCLQLPGPPHSGPMQVSR